MSLPVDIWKQLPTCLASSTLTSSDYELVCFESLEPEPRHAKKAASAQRARECRSADIRRAVLLAAAPWSVQLVEGVPREVPDDELLSTPDDVLVDEIRERYSAEHYRGTINKITANVRRRLDEHPELGKCRKRETVKNILGTVLCST